MRTLTVIATVLGLTLVGCTKEEPAKPSGCGSDKDCKGSRICEKGACVATAGRTNAPVKQTTKKPVPAKQAPAAKKDKTAASAKLPAAAKKPVEPTRVALLPPPKIGAKAPLVVLVEFGDFQCKYCSRTIPTLKKLIKQYGKPDGILTYEWRNNPLNTHKHAARLAALAASANRQGRFWQFHDFFFGNQKGLDPAKLKKFAASTKIDVARWSKEANSAQITQPIEAERRVAQALGARGTPAFFVNGRLMLGLQSYAQFRKVIEEEAVKGAALIKAGKPRKSVPLLLQKKNNPDYVRYIHAGQPAPEPKRRKAPVWHVPVGDDDPSIGAKDALVTLVEFANFECPHCKKYHSILRGLVNANPKELRLVFKQAPLPTHKQSFLAAEAALAAHAQGKFWAFHDRLFSQSPKLSRADLMTAAKAVGLDITAFAAALEKGTYRKRVALDKETARQASARGTPNLFVNGRKLVGAQSLEALKKFITEELLRARSIVKAGVPATAFYSRLMAKAKRVKAPTAHRAFLKIDRKTTPSLGKADAPVTAIVFTDFESPFGSRLAPILNGVSKKYAGKLRLAVKHFPHASHRHATNSALAAICAHQQQRFWPMYKALFENQKDLTPKSIRGYAKKAGVKLKAFDKCLSSPSTKQTLALHIDEGQRAGVRGTPMIFLNNLRFSPPTGYNRKSISAAIERLLTPPQNNAK